MSLKLNRHKRQIGDNDQVYLNRLGVSAGVPDEFKAQNEIRAGLESILHD